MSERPPPLAKITRPRIRGVFPRDRLFGLLDETREYPRDLDFRPGRFREDDAGRQLSREIIRSPASGTRWMNEMRTSPPSSITWAWRRKRQPRKNGNPCPFSPPNIYKAYPPLPCGTLRTFSAGLRSLPSWFWIIIRLYRLNPFFMR